MTSQKPPASAGAVHFEARKSGMRQSSSGLFVTLQVHPHEMPEDLIVSPTGARYMVALVRLGDADEPITTVKPGKTNEIDRVVQSAGMLCAQPAFQAWLVDQGLASEASEAAAAEAVRAHCGVASRAALAEDMVARQAFLRMRAAFAEDTGA